MLSSPVPTNSSSGGLITCRAISTRRKRSSWLKYGASPVEPATRIPESPPPA